MDDNPNYSESADRNISDDSIELIDIASSDSEHTTEPPKLNEYSDMSSVISDEQLNSSQNECNALKDYYGPNVGTELPNNEYTTKQEYLPSIPSMKLDYSQLPSTSHIVSGTLDELLSKLLQCNHNQGSEHHEHVISPACSNLDFECSNSVSAKIQKGREKFASQHKEQNKTDDRYSTISSEESSSESDEASFDIGEIETVFCNDEKQNVQPPSSSSSSSSSSSDDESDKWWESLNDSSTPLHNSEAIKPKNNVTVATETGVMKHSTSDAENSNMKKKVCTEEYISGIESRKRKIENPIPFEAKRRLSTAQSSSTSLELDQHSSSCSTDNGVVNGKQSHETSSLEIAPPFVRKNAPENGASKFLIPSESDKNEHLRGVTAEKRKYEEEFPVEARGGPPIAQNEYWKKNMNNVCIRGQIMQ